MIYKVVKSSYEIKKAIQYGVASSCLLHGSCQKLYWITKSIFLIVVLLIGYLECIKSQSFLLPGVYISDFVGDAKADTFIADIQGLPNQIGRSFGISKVTINITHRRVFDLNVAIVSPSGVDIWLTNINRGDTGSGYTNNSVRSNGFFGYIYKGRAPFEGEYIPDGRFSFLNLI